MNHNDPLQTVRKVARGYATAHRLAADKTAGSIMADWESDVAAQFATVADLLDQATATRPRVPSWRGPKVVADAGVWAPGADDDGAA